MNYVDENLKFYMNYVDENLKSIEEKNSWYYNL